MGRRAVRREESAARLRALTRRAYTAGAGHLDLDDDAGREFDRIVRGDSGGEERPARGRARRWAVSVRAAVVVLAVVTALAGAVVLRSLASASAPVPLPELTETAGAAAERPADAEGGTGGSGSSGRGDHQPPWDTDEGDVGTTAPDARGEGGPGAASETAAPGVVVHVAGAVAAPGVVELPAGARVADAVAAAGGADADAELAAVNLARPVQDGEQVYVPVVGEAAPGTAAGRAVGTPGTATAGAPAGAGGTADLPVVDLNTADATALDTLPGVGPAIAQRILEWREAHGPFHSVEELLEVSGIGPATLERLRDRVRV